MRQTRLLVLGFDAMDVELVRRWAAAGYLPTFRRLFESAAWTEYCHSPEITSGSVFPTINTGLGPLRHDGQEYLRMRDGSYRLRFCRPADIKGDPFWASFVQANRRILLADVPFTMPKPEYGGKQFSGWGSHDAWPWRRMAVPSGLLRALSAQFGAHPVPYCNNYTTETDSLMRLRSGLLTGIERRTAILKSLIASRDWDLFYGVYAEPHCAGHLMWHLEDKTHPWHSPEQLAMVGHALREIYAAIDRALGELLACVGTDTTCVAFFSHGMGPNYHAVHLFPEVVERFNRRWAGKSLLPDEATPPVKGSGLDRLWKASIHRIPIAWRQRAREHLPTSLRVWLFMRRMERSRQWSRMPAFPLPMDGLSALRVNLAGRDPKGQLRAGEEYRRFLDALVAELSGLMNAETGEPVVARSFRADQQIDPVTMGTGPDLIIWWSNSAPIRTLRSPTLGTMAGECPDVRTGEHVMRGMLLISHPRAKPGRHQIEGMSAMDIPATLCDLAGVRPAGRLDGVNRRKSFVAD